MMLRHLAAWTGKPAWQAWRAKIATLAEFTLSEAEVLARNDGGLRTSLRMVIASRLGACANAH